MIKIISGKYRNRKLKYFNLKNVRPTQARVRKSILEILQPFDNKQVLDLFSGIGTLGIESLSRGAKSVVFVDNERRTLNVLKKNLELLSIINNYSVINSDVFQYIKNLEQKFDIIFADPPYGKYDFLDLLPYIKKILNDDGIFCYESKKTKFKGDLNVKLKYFGSTQVTIWRKQS